MWGMSAISANEIRRLENQAPYEGGDQFFAQAGFMPVEDLKNYHLSKNKKDEPKE
jgi:hypothetical protein